MEPNWGYGETVVRFGAFAVVFLVMALLERAIPRRQPVVLRRQRWATNLLLIAIDSAIVRSMAALSIPIAAVSAAAFAQRQGWGVLSLLHAPGWVGALCTMIVLDFAVWLQHVISHKVPLLWRLHRMHHADRDVDVTTAIRFHPIEIALSMLYKIAWVLALGAPPVAVFAFEIVLNGCAMFNHANIALPRALDRAVRVLLVTPDMHRIHHSTIRSEHDANYGFNLAVWDRLFGTYTAEPSQEHGTMSIGLTGAQHDGPCRIGWSLLVPFRGTLGDA